MYINIVIIMNPETCNLYIILCGLGGRGGKDQVGEEEGGGMGKEIEGGARRPVWEEPQPT
jgi:hypothetical protein